MAHICHIKTPEGDRIGLSAMCLDTECKHHSHNQPKMNAFTRRMKKQFSNIQTINDLLVRDDVDLDEKRSLQRAVGQCRLEPTHRNCCYVTIRSVILLVMVDSNGHIDIKGWNDPRRVRNIHMKFPWKLCFTCGAMCTEKCGGCGIPSYCSVECQKAHWLEHKVVCQAIQSKSVNS